MICLFAIFLVGLVVGIFSRHEVKHEEDSLKDEYRKGKISASELFSRPLY